MVGVVKSIWILNMPFSKFLQMVVWEFHDINYLTWSIGGVLNDNALLEFFAKGIFGISQTQIGAHLPHMKNFTAFDFTHMKWDLGISHMPFSLSWNLYSMGKNWCETNIVTYCFWKAKNNFSDRLKLKLIIICHL